jgi:hypothetical protein
MRTALRAPDDRRPLTADLAVKRRARAVLGAACSIHFLHDGFSETL